jgi:hypothetical protein
VALALRDSSLGSAMESPCSQVVSLPRPLHARESESASCETTFGRLLSVWRRIPRCVYITGCYWVLTTTATGSIQQPAAALAFNDFLSDLIRGFTGIRSQLSDPRTGSDPDVTVCEIANAFVPGRFGGHGRLDAAMALSPGLGTGVTPQSSVTVRPRGR